MREKGGRDRRSFVREGSEETKFCESGEGGDRQIMREKGGRGQAKLLM